MSRFRKVASFSVIALLTALGSAKAQDVAAGEAVFAKCKACHAVGEDAKNKVGPHLNGVVSRAAGSVDGYKYSPAMVKQADSGLAWDEANLREYLANPRGFLKGTKMAFSGLKKEQDVTNVITYLGTFAEDGSQKVAEAGPATEAAEQAVAGTKLAEAEAGGTAIPQPAAPQGGDGLKLGLGRAATEDEIAAWDIDVRPDGLGLPEGRGTAAQGMAVYDEQCASCHGDFGEAIGRWPVLAGGQGTLEDERPEKTIGSYWPYLSTVYDYVRRAMPFGNARSLSNDDVYALTAYLLYLNNIVDDEEFELSKENFAGMKLPNEQNFIDDDRTEEPFYAAKSEPCMSDCKPGKPEITMHAAVLDVTPEDSGEEEAPAGGMD